jgi:hypothetical protein
MIGCEELIATTPEEFVKYAISLAQEPERVAALKSKVLANISRAYQDLDCIKGLEDTLITWTS